MKEQLFGIVAGALALAVFVGALLLMDDPIQMTEMDRYILERSR